MSDGSERGERFLKSDRIRKRREYLQVQQRGRKIHLKDVLAFLYPRDGQRRLGVTVSSRVGGAVQRNRIKRLMREAWRRNRELMPHGYDLVLVAKRTASEATYRDIERQLQQLVRRAFHGRKG